MRILHLASSHRWTGVAEPAACLAAEQLKLGHDVDFACIEGESFWRRLGAMGVPALSGFHLMGGVHLGGMIADIRRLRRLATEKGYDVVHCHLTHDHWLAALGLKRGRAGRAEKGTREPILVRTLHRDVPPRRDLFHRRLYCSATDLLIAVSRSGRACVEERLNLNDDRVAWIRGAVDLDRFRPDVDGAPNRDRWFIPKGSPVAGLLARMQPHRGHLDLLETIDAVVGSVPDAIYIVGGRGEHKVKVRALIEKHPLRRHYRPVGYRKRDLPETYAAMDVFVLLAQGSDGTCRAMLEAMAGGKPVIGINRGAVADTIEPGKTGWLIEPGDKDALTEALIEALGNRKRTAEMGIAARAKVESEFTQRERAEKTIAAYEGAIKRRAG